MKCRKQCKFFANGVAWCTIPCDRSQYCLIKKRKIFFFSSSMGCSLCTKPSTWPNTIFLQWRLSAWKVKYVWNDFYLSNHHRSSFSSLSTLFCEKYNYYWNWPYSISFQVSMEHSPSLCFSGLPTSSKISLTLGLVLTRGSRSVKEWICQAFFKKDKNWFCRPSTDLLSMM